MAEDPALSVTARLFPVRPLVSASVAIFRDGLVLLARRRGGSGAGLFSLPGGLIELGEGTEAAALREAVEETGVQAEILGLAGHVDVVEASDSRICQHYVVLAFAARWLWGVPRPSLEASECLWANMDALGPLPLTKGLPDILRKAQMIVQKYDGDMRP